MEKQFTLKKLVIYLSCVFIALIFISLLLLAIFSHKTVAAFYGIPEANQKKIQTILQSTSIKKNKKIKPYEFITLDSTVPLKKAIKATKKPDLLFIYGGLNADYAASLAVKSKTCFSKDILNGMSSSVIQTVQILNDKVPAVPLLIDHYEIDVHSAKFDSSSINDINTLSDVEEFARLSKSSTMSPIIFAAGDDIELINVFAALVEAVSGRKALESGAEKIRKSISIGKTSQTAFYNLLLELTTPGGEWYETSELLKQWSKMNILPKNIFQMKSQDISAFLESNLSVVAFMTLSEHRKIKRDVISRYTSTFIPGTSVETERNLTAPIIYAIQLKKGKQAKTSIKLFADSLQGSLCAKTGLAPVQKNSTVPDIQSDDVRYWVAASGKPMPALSDAAFTNKPNRSAFAEALRTILKD
ncbi:MAG: hypothetical protein IJL70_09950 [Treponema sp.]|nr:hypothetical protein [Treponema sp.]